MARTSGFHLAALLVLTITAGCGKDSPTGPSSAPPVPVIQSTVSITPGQYAVINFTVDRSGTVSSRIDWTSTALSVSARLHRGRCTVEQVVTFATGCDGSAAIATSDGLSKPVVLAPVLESGDHTLVLRSRLSAVETLSYRLEGNVSGASPPVTSAIFAAAATAQQARFYFPVSSQPVWEWYLGAANVLEYTWSVEVQNGPENFLLGAFLYKPANAQPRQGTLESLLQTMQHSVFLMTGLGGTLLWDAPVSVGLEGPFVVVNIDDPRTMARVLSRRPSVVVLHARIPGQEWISRTVEVLYGS